jgi:hypothetical protein
MRAPFAASVSLGLALAGTVFVPTLAQAHVGISSGPAVANSTSEIVFAVGHGCAGMDTLSIKIDIPASVTAVRAGTSNLGRATFERNAALAITAVKFEKPEAELIAGDDNYYKVSLRIKVPNTPFAPLYFPVHQTCKAPNSSTTTVVDWVSTTPNEGHGDGGPAMEPAAVLMIVPDWKPGWNKFTVPSAIANSELGSFFAGAQVVWKGAAAYSANPSTVAQIKATAGVTELTALAAGDEVWVKF